MEHKITIYSKDHCPYCVAAKDFFRRKNVPFVEIDLTNKFAEIDALKKRTSFATLPQIFINDEFIGGYTDLLEKIKQGIYQF